MSTTENQQGPLGGLNVIDFGHYFPGPTAAMLLADQGANVIRIIRPGSRELPEQQYSLLNRNKKIIELDLKTPEGKNRALSLIKQADVLIENFRPGVMQRLGLGYRQLKDKNPGLIYLSIPGFAPNDKRAHLQAWEGIISAATGVYTDMHLVRQMLNFPPLYSWVPIISMYSGINGAIAIMAALISRLNQGFGTLIEIPMYDMAKACIQARPTAYASLPEPLQELQYSPGDDRETQLEKLEKAHQALWTNMLSMTFPCKDGRHINIGTFFLPHLAQRLIEALGIKGAVYRAGLVNCSTWETGLDNNLCAKLSPDNWQRFEKLVREALLTRSADEWEDILTRNRVMAAKVRSREEWLTLEPTLDAKVHVTMPCHTMPYTMPHKNVQQSSTLIVPGRAAQIDTPQETSDEFSPPQLISPDQAEALFKPHPHKTRPQGESPNLRQGDLLKGLKVLDMANAMAGPVGSWWLAQYGADVIKPDPPQFPGSMAVTEAGGWINQGKRSMLNDIATAPGREVFRRLVKWADVVTHNVVDGTSERLGVAHHQLSRINPNLVSAQISGFGGNCRGGWEKRVAFDFSLQAASGMMAQYGTLDRPHIHGAAKAADVVAGFTLAFAALVGVWQQRTSGYAGECRTSLALANDYCQLPYMIAENGASHWGEPQGQFARGEHAGQRLYLCSDGWLYVGTHKSHIKALIATVSGNETATKTSTETSTETSDTRTLEACFIEQSCEHWHEKLCQAGIASHRVLHAHDLYLASSIRDVTSEFAHETANGNRELLRCQNHPSGAEFLQDAATWVRIGEQRSCYRLRTGFRYGEFTTEILKELGYSAEEIAELIRLGVAHEYLPPLKNRKTYFHTPG